VRLFNRTTRRVSPTDAGEKLLARIRPAIMELGAAVDDLNEFRDTPTGVLRLNVSSAAARIVLAPAIKAFLAAYPAIALDITVEDSRGDIAGGRFDAGIRVGRLVAKDMQIVRVSEPSRLIAIAAPAYLRQNPAPKTPQDLQQHNCIRLRSDGQLLAWDFAKGKSRFEISVSGTLIVNNMNLMVQAALDGIGIGYTIESYVSSDIEVGCLVPLLADWSPEHHSYYLYYSGRRQLPIPLQVFIAFLRQYRSLTRRRHVHGS
jgi:DNA-binding transcriptional LysR family regulator